MRRAIVIVVIIALVAGGSWLAYSQIGSARAPKTADYETVKIGRGNITSTVSATGDVLPERDASLTFQGTGTIEKVSVRQGDAVKAGQLLAQLDTVDLELALRQAQVGLQTAEAQLRQLQEPANPVDIAAAEAQVASAQAALDKVSKGATAAELSSAQAAVRSAQAGYDAAVQSAGTSDSQLEASSAALQRAQAALQQAQSAYDKVRDVPGVAMLPQSTQLQQATIDMQQAKANYDALLRTTQPNAKSKVDSAAAQLAQARAALDKLAPTADALAAAQAQVAQARSGLDKLKRGPSTAQVDVSKANVEQARLTLQQAQRKLDNARLVAPWDGVVTAVNATEGTLPQAGAPAVQLADVSLYHINVRVDEADIASVAEGQPVSIELDAFANQKLAGHVARIAPSASNETTAGVVTYEVRIDIEPAKLALRNGMSATATITSNSRDNVLLVPNRALQVDRESGKTYVDRLAGDAPQRVEVRLGLRGDQMTEVRDGLQDGDQVAIQSVSSLNKLQQAMEGQ